MVMNPFMWQAIICLSVLFWHCSSFDDELKRFATKSSQFNCKQIFWMHTPKTGSTFCLSLQHVCCKDQFEELVGNVTMNDLKDNELLPSQEQTFKFVSQSGCFFFTRKDYEAKPCVRSIGGGHAPLKDISLLKIAVFRDPRTRIVSSFLDGMHHEGMSDYDYQKLKKSWNFTAENKINNLAKQLNSYANHPNMIGCQVKMLNGLDCSSPNITSSRQFNQTALDVAINRLRGFYFVGLFEKYDLSVHLFHMKMGQNTSASSVELFPRRTTNPEMAEALLRRLSLVDPYDTPLYEEAKSLFIKEYHMLAARSSVHHWKTHHFGGVQ